MLGWLKQQPILSCNHAQLQPCLQTCSAAVMLMLNIVAM